MTQSSIPLTDDEFEKAISNADLPVLVDFWAPWCGPCRMVAPALEELAEELSGRLKIAKVNTDEEQTSAMRLGVRGIPTLVLFRDGKEIDRFVGALPKAALRQWVEGALGNGAR